jgi:hypothetical protein
MGVAKFINFSGICILIALKVFIIPELLSKVDPILKMYEFESL